MRLVPPVMGEDVGEGGVCGAVEEEWCRRGVCSGCVVSCEL